MLSRTFRMLLPLMLMMLSLRFSIGSLPLCYIYRIKPPFHIVNAFARRTWGKFGIEKVSLLKSGVFMVKFRNLDGRNKLRQGLCCLTVSRLS